VEQLSLPLNFAVRWLTYAKKCRPPPQKETEKTKSEIVFCYNLIKIGIAACPHMNIPLGRVFFPPGRPTATFAFVFIRRFAFDSVTAATCHNKKNV